MKGKKMKYLITSSPKSKALRTEGNSGFRASAFARSRKGATRRASVSSPSIRASRHTCTGLYFQSYSRSPWSSVQ